MYLVIVASWAFSYGGDSTETGSLCRQQTADNGHIMAGITHSYVSHPYGEGGILIKTDVNGALQWAKYYRNSSASQVELCNFNYAKINRDFSV